MRAAIEALPAELARVADEVYVQLPWGALLEGIVLARSERARRIARLCRPGARVTVTLNGEIWLDSTPARYAHLPVPTPEYVADVVRAGLRRSRHRRSEPARYATAAEAKALPTTWARRLGHGARRIPRFVQFEGVAPRPDAGSCRRRATRTGRRHRRRHRAASATRPPWSSAICSTIASPRPEPGTVRAVGRPVEPVEHVGQVVRRRCPRPGRGPRRTTPRTTIVDCRGRRAELQGVVEQVGDRAVEQR